ncbi:MAG TPA: ABC transporter permease subunit [Tepidisphaeraceae bacterium]|jgi:NitT/TauT family transport system permease protein
MGLYVFHTKRVREALEKPASIGIDLLLVGGVAALIGGFFMFSKQIAAPYTPTVNISLSFKALPKYTLFSLSRGFAAYVLSLVFTLIYGTVAAHNHRAEKVMIPALDVLQAIPVLGFLPSLVLAMISLFPTREFGLELACIVMVFTAQVWNMTFSFHGSLRGIPPALREVARINGFSGWQTFRMLEVPAAMIGLVWNSMMSMAGGWFFLTVNEAFTLGNHDFRLPGLGSYMKEAIDQGNVSAMIAAVIAMVVMIVVVDQVFWRPIVVWAQRFKLEDLTGGDAPQSWLLNLIGHSPLYAAISRYISARRKANPEKIDRLNFAKSSPEREKLFAVARKALMILVQIGLALAVAWGAWSLFKLMKALPIHAANHDDYLHLALALLLSFVRTSVAVLLGAAWALPVGIRIGLSPTWSRRLQPIIQVVASFPAPMLFPLVAMALIATHTPFTGGCILLMLLGAQWYILFNVIAGASAIPADLKEVAAVYNMSEKERWKKVYLPCVFPYLLTGLITAAGGAWNATIVSEYVQVKGHTLTAFGLGSIISRATNDGNFPLLTASVVIMAVFVVLVNRVFWKRLYRLAEDRYSLAT